MSGGERGDAFSAFYRGEHSQQVRRAVLLVGSQAVAEEVVHEAFVGVFARWDVMENPAAYLTTSVVNGCRRQRRRQTLVDVGNDEDAALVEIGDHSREEEVVMARLLMALPFRQRAAIVLRYYARMPESEIAEVLQCRPGTVGPAIHRGLAKLRKELT